MRNVKVFFLFVFVMMLSQHLLAQSTTVTGKVTDSQGYEVIGANILLKGSNGQGTITDVNGMYTIQVNNVNEDVLIISYVGMKKKKVRIKGRKVVNIQLKDDAVALNEVVAIGYATTRRKDLTGSVASVQRDDLLKTPTSNVAQALAGRVAGVHITQNEGAPGAAINIRVRGGISITQSNEPLYIIDGFPSEDGMSTLNPQEIESIDILKDASATAIYGARGANGVVVITTKNASSGKNKMTVSLDCYLGVDRLAKKLDVLSPLEFVWLDYERSFDQVDNTEDMARFNKNYGDVADINANYANRPGLNWQDLTLGGDKIKQNYHLNISGGNSSLRYALAYNYYKSEGAMVHSGTSRHNVSFSLDHKLTNKVKVTARVNYDERKVYGMGTSGDGDRFNKLQHILQYRPTIGVLGEDADMLTMRDPILENDNGSVMQNPLISASEETNDKEYRTFRANAGVTIDLIEGMKFTNTTGMRYQHRRYDVFYGDQSVKALRSSINGSIHNLEYGSFQTSNVLSYQKQIGVHRMTAMVGQEYVKRWTRNVKTVATNFPNDDIGLADMSLGTPGIPSSSKNFDDNLLSFFGRVNYTYQDKYLFTASLRADGSSKFGKNNKWGYFPAVSGAWRASEEDFIKNLGIFSDLKLRMGYGLSGNNRIGSYNSLAILGSVTYPTGDATSSGYVSTQIPNPELKWEANKTFNLGLDFGFFNQRLTISPEFYINRSDDLLLNAKIPMSSGYTNMMINAGSTENKGLDLTISSVNIEKKDFRWTTNFNVSHNKNIIKRLTGEQVQLHEARFGYNQNTHILEVGKSLGQFYGFVTEGLYQVADFNYDAGTGKYTLKDDVACAGDRNKVKPGQWKFANIDASDNEINENDKTVIGNALPDFYGGLNNTFSYKNFDLSVFFTFSYGNDVLNATKLTNTKSGIKNYNTLASGDRSHRWTTIDAKGNKVTEPTALAELNRGKTIASQEDMQVGDTYIHSWAVEDGSYIKLSNVTLGYTFPKTITKKLRIKSLRLYATATNLYTWTNYTGYDPEVSTHGSGLTPGVDFGAYPRSRSFVFGLNLKF
jgi:TonB-linked SusC/RagA family outer membrane protein